MRGLARRGCRPADRALIAWFVLSTLPFIAGCDPVSHQVDEAFLLARARAAVAFAEAEVGQSDRDALQTECDDCRGTGMVPSGDGLAHVPCDCAAMCQCRPPAAVADGSMTVPASTPRQRRLLYFSASWCATCRANEPTFLALRNAGWKIGDGSENHIQTIDVDDFPDLARRYDVHSVPTSVLIDNDREVRRRCGALRPFEIGTMFEQ